MERIPVSFINGINRADHLTRIPDGEVYLTQNLHVDNDGVLQLRPGSLRAEALQYGPSPGIGKPVSEVQSILAPLDVANNVLSVVRYTSEYYVYLHDFETGITSLVQVSTKRQPLGRLSYVDTGRDVYMVSGRGFVDTGEVVRPLLRVNYSVPGGTLTPLNLTDNPDVWPRVVAMYKRRFVYLDLGNGFEDYVAMSDPYEPTIIGLDVTAANGRAFKVGSGADGRIVAAIEIMQTAVGSPSESALLILRERAAYLLTGEPSLTTDSGGIFSSMVLSRLSINAGCASADTIVRTPHGIIWASDSDVWLFELGSLPRPIGRKIRPLLQAGHPWRRPSWHAVWDGTHYRLAISEDSSEPALGKDSIVPCEKEYWLNLSLGAPASWRDARWFGYMEYVSRSMHKTVDMSSGSPRVLMVTNTLVESGGDRIANLLDVMPSTPTYIDEGAAAGFTQPFWKLESRTYMQDDPFTLMQLHGVDFLYDMADQQVTAQLFRPNQSMSVTKDFGNSGEGSIDSMAFNMEAGIVDQTPSNQVRVQLSGIAAGSSEGRARIYAVAIKYDSFGRLPDGQ